MRIRLLLLVACVTGLAVPAALLSERPDLLPGSGTAGQAWGDAGRIVSLVYANARRGLGEDEVAASEPVFEERRLVRTASVVGATLVWFVAFVLGGSAGLLYLSRSRSLIDIGIALASLYSCSSVSMSVSLNVPPDLSAFAKVALGLGLGGIAAGLLASRTIHRAGGARS